MPILKLWQLKELLAANSSPPHNLFPQPSPISASKSLQTSRDNLVACEVMSAVRPQTPLWAIWVSSLLYSFCMSVSRSCLLAPPWTYFLGQKATIHQLLSSYKVRFLMVFFFTSFMMSPSGIHLWTWLSFVFNFFHAERSLPSLSWTVPSHSPSVLWARKLSLNLQLASGGDAGGGWDAELFNNHYLLQDGSGVEKPHIYCYIDYDHGCTRTPFKFTIKLKAQAPLFMSPETRREIEEKKKLCCLGLILRLTKYHQNSPMFIKCRQTSSSQVAIA